MSTFVRYREAHPEVNFRENNPEGSMASGDLIRATPWPDER